MSVTISSSELTAMGTASEELTMGSSSGTGRSQKGFRDPRRENGRRSSAIKR